MMRPSHRMTMRRTARLREAIRGEHLRRSERLVVRPDGPMVIQPGQPSEGPHPADPPDPAAPSAPTSPEPTIVSTQPPAAPTQPSIATVEPALRDRVESLRALDAVELLSSRRVELTTMLEQVRAASRDRPIEAAMQRRLSELRALPRTPPESDTRGWVAVRIAGDLIDGSGMVPLSGVTVELHTEGEEEPFRTSTDPLGVALMKLSARGPTGATVHVMSPRGDSLVSRPLPSGSDRPAMVIEVPADDSIEAAFAAGRRFHAAVAAAEAEAERLEQRLAAERTKDQEIFAADLDAVERTLQTVVDGTGGGE